MDIEYLIHSWPNKALPCIYHCELNRPDYLKLQRHVIKCLTPIILDKLVSIQIQLTHTVFRIYTHQNGYSYLSTSLVCIKLNTTLSISLCRYIIQIQLSLYILRYVSNQIQLSLYLYVCIKSRYKSFYISLDVYPTPDTTISISLSMYQIQIQLSLYP